MEKQPYWLAVADELPDSLEPFGVLVVRNKGINIATFGYDKQDLLSALELCDEAIEREDTLRYQNQVLNSKLPEQKDKFPIIIDGFAATRFAAAYEAYFKAFHMVFTPHSSWPVMKDIPHIGFAALYPNRSQFVNASAIQLDLCSVILSISDNYRSLVYIAYSWEQYEYVTEELKDCAIGSGLNLSRNFSLISKESALPEISNLPVQRIEGSIAVSISKILLYFGYMYKETMRLSQLGRTNPMLQ